MTPERLLLEYRACAEHIIEIDGDRDDMNQSRVTVMYSVGAAKFVLQAADEIERLHAVIAKVRRMADKVRSDDGGEALAELCDRALEQTPT